jgi:hypothetical protein
MITIVMMIISITASPSSSNIIIMVTLLNPSCNPCGEAVQTYMFIDFPLHLCIRQPAMLAILVAQMKISGN